MFSAKTALVDELSPAKSMNTFSPAGWVWRMDGLARPFQTSQVVQNHV
jgi:hypothetical protein